MAVLSIASPLMPFLRPIANGFVLVAVSGGRMALHGYRIFGSESEVLLREIWDANFLERKEMLNRKDVSPEQLEAEKKGAGQGNEAEAGAEAEAD